MSQRYPTDGSFFAAPYAFDVPEVGPCHRDGVPLFGVFSYEDGPDEGPYCLFSGSRVEADQTARRWNYMVARGTAHLIKTSPVLRYF